MELKTKPAITTSDVLINHLETLTQDTPIYVSLNGTDPDFTITHIEDSTSVGWYEIRIRDFKDRNQYCLDTVEKLVRALKKETSDDFIYVTKCNSAPMDIITEIIYSELHQCYLMNILHNVGFDDVKWLHYEVIIKD